VDLLEILLLLIYTDLDCFVLLLLIGCQEKLHVQMTAYFEYNFHFFLAMHLPLELKFNLKKWQTKAEE
jgi:hypothetical protein